MTAETILKLIEEVIDKEVSVNDGCEYTARMVIEWLHRNEKLAISHGRKGENG